MCFRSKPYLFFLIVLFSCTSDLQKKDDCALANAFFRHYKARSDWKGFLDRYHPDVTFEDVILQMELNGVEDFAAFYNWPDTLFNKHPDFPNTLRVESLVCDDKTAVARGYFTPFYYNDIFYTDTAHMRFTMWLEFDARGLITRHIDYIEYPPEILRTVANRLISEQDSTNRQ